MLQGEAASPGGRSGVRRSRVQMIGGDDVHASRCVSVSTASPTATARCSSAGESGSARRSPHGGSTRTRPRREAAVPRRQLRGPLDEPARVGALRSREGRVHGCRQAFARAASSWPTGARCCSTRSARSRRPSRRSCFGCSRSSVFERVGSSTSAAPWTCGSSPRRTATSRRRGRARARSVSDLFFRLNVLPLAVPPLRAAHARTSRTSCGCTSSIDDRPSRGTRGEADGARRPSIVLRNVPVAGQRPRASEHLRAGLRARRTARRSSRPEPIEPWLSSTPVANSPPVRPGVLIETKAPALLPRRAERRRAGAPPPRRWRSQADRCTDLNSAFVCGGDHQARRRSSARRSSPRSSINNGHRQKSAQALGIGVRTLGLKLKKWEGAEDRRSQTL